MKSTTARKGLEGKKRWLEKQLADSKKKAEEMRSKLENAHRETIEIGKHKVVVAHTDQRLEREYDDATRVQGEIEYQIKEIEFLLHPPKGRPKGRRNEQSKPPDSTIAAALELRKTAAGRKLTLIKLAKECSGLKTRAEWKKWIYRLNYAKRKALRSRS